LSPPSCLCSAVPLPAQYSAESAQAPTAARCMSATECRQNEANAFLLRTFWYERLLIMIPQPSSVPIPLPPRFLMCTWSLQYTLLTMPKLANLTQQKQASRQCSCYSGLLFGKLSGTCSPYQGLFMSDLDNPRLETGDADSCETEN
jgi:hypothetical protein